MAEDKPSKTEKLNIRQERYRFHFDHGLNIEERVILITGEIGADTVFEHVDASITALERESKQPITVRIYSGGGGLYEASAIVGRLTSSVCDIYTEGYGSIMSAAVLILACGDTRRISKYATCMHHEAATHFYGKTAGLKEDIEQMEREEHQRAEWLAEFSKLSAEDWRAMGVKRDYYMTAEECLEAGIVDEII